MTPTSPSIPARSAVCLSSYIRAPLEKHLRNSRGAPSCGRFNYYTHPALFVTNALLPLSSRCKHTAMVQNDLQATFLSFASYGTRQPESQLEGSKFKKLCTDCGLLDKKFTVTDVDLIFQKAKTKGARKMSFEEFAGTALPLIAEKKGVSVDDIKSKLTAADGPQTNATQADYVKFHDDKSTFTGVYARGGPTNVDGGADLSDLCDRSDANVRGVTEKFANSR